MPIIRETLSFWTWDSQSGININLVILAVNVLVFWTILIFTELNITKLLWIKMKEMVYGSKVEMPSNVDSDVKLEKDSVFQVKKQPTGKLQFLVLPSLCPPLPSLLALLICPLFCPPKMPSFCPS